MKRASKMATVALLPLALAFTAAPAQDKAPVQFDIAPYIKKAEFEDIKISPTGEYYAATIPLEDRTGLVILRRSDNKISAGFSIGKNTVVYDFTWVNPNRVLISTARKIGAMDQPRPTGDIYAIDANGKNAEILVGQSVDVMTTGTNIVTKKNEQVAAFLIDSLPADENNVVISVSTFGNDPSSRVEIMDVRSGKRRQIARAPMRNADFMTDNAGQVRFVYGGGLDNVNKLYHRRGTNADWELVNDESASGRVETPIGFSADDKVAYLQVQQANGPDKIVSMDMESKARKDLLQDADASPGTIIYRQGTSIPVGARYYVGKLRTGFFDTASPEARLYRSLEAAFAGRSPFVTSYTADGKFALVQVSGDRGADEFYIFDTQAKTAAFLLSTRPWIDPAKRGERRPISLQARDGLELKGYVTLPAGQEAHNLPMVVLPHGGPFGIYDEWRYDDEAQLLASAGYAVLQVNFRGSGGRGRAFRNAGAREWGGKMQDDLTDATKWTIREGIADAGRVCIYGASYGGYAALMGAAKEPGLYKCAAGYIGVYDLPMMYKRGDTQESEAGAAYIREWIGEKDALASVSPVYLADRIKVPVFLAAGGEDKRAPIEHTKAMEKALRTANVPVETLYYPSEGHGFYTQPHRTEYYTKLLAFLGRNIGGATAGAAQAK
ncbi:alpha/beta hydrolase family protein [Luteimonas aquatica]|uniref:alpha/beta hydrolase family protein n=1 Tax=Luteimonas aquatica TaxID=450364 RepID=UPI001F591965|nr:S9 family peptidase [Luteimonas aquatica]